MSFRDAFYELKFEISFRKAKGDEFQTFFERLMGLAYKADFMACRPWGNVGDRKNDGFLRSEKCLFQVYAPDEMSAAEAIRKINADFEGAKEHWSSHLSKWVFAHNATGGLPPHVHEAVLSLSASNPDMLIETWGLEEFRLVFRRLTSADRESWFGLAPSDETQMTLGFKDIQVVLESIGGMPTPSVPGVREVPFGKIEANALSVCVRELLLGGMGKAPLVSDFFAQWHDETLGERLAVAFRSKYEDLRQMLSPNEIFAELQSWAAGERRGRPEIETAVIAVIAYFFERCDIFEEPRSRAR